MAIVGDGSVLLQSPTTKAFNLENVQVSGDKKIEVTTPLDLHPDTNFGDVSVVISDGATLYATASQLSGVSVAGEGSLVLTALPKNFDFSGIDLSGDFNINLSGSVDIDSTAHLGTANLSLDNSAIVTLDAAQLVVGNGIREIEGDGNLILGSTVSADLDLGAIDVNVSFADDTADLGEGISLSVDLSVTQLSNVTGQGTLSILNLNEDDAALPNVQETVALGLVVSSQ